MNLRAMQAEDWPRVAEIYGEGIATGNATFEQQVPEWDAWDRTHLDACRWVAFESERVVGWSALRRVSERRAYAGVADVNLYVEEKARGRGIGRALLEALVGDSEEHGIWMLQAGIFPENTASVAVHERAGFRLVGRRERIGRLHGRWRDVLLFERRSPKVG